MPKRNRIKAAGLKGSRTLAKCGSSAKKSRQSEFEGYRSSFPKDARRAASEEEEELQFSEDEEEDEQEEDEEEENSLEGVEELEVHRQPSVYEDLLEKLQGSSNVQAIGDGRRKSKEKNVSDSAKEGDIKFASDEGAKLEGISTSSSDEETSDEENKFVEEMADEQASSSLCQSKFYKHIAHNISTEDSEKLLKRTWKYRWTEIVPGLTNGKWIGTGDNFLKDADATATAPYGLELKLYKHWLNAYDTSGGRSFQSSKQRLFFSLCNSYRDILHHNKRPFYRKGSDEDSSVMDAYVMHSLNHVLKTRDLVLKNAARLPKDKEEERKMVIEDESFADRSFTRPKVLILLPLASIAFRIVRRFIQLTPAGNKVNVEYMDRFNKEFGVDIEQDDDDEIEAKKPSKPVDHQALFGGNCGDNFMVGIKFTRKSIKLYSDFYSSDVIVASPVGLIKKLGEAQSNKDKNVDYLSSIEILVVDHADVIAMQNWSHLKTVIEHLNRLPSAEIKEDTMRIRRWYCDGLAQFYRQSIILSSYLNPDMNALFNQHCLNFEGKLRLSCEHKGVLSKVILQVRQVYERFDSASIGDADDARLNYFINKVFPKIKDSTQGGIMLFVPSHLESVRLRNFLKSQNASFCLVEEETPNDDISRARNWFIQGQRKIMLYTARIHFYRRFKIRGIQSLIIYSLPEIKEFYPEILNMLEGSHNMTCSVLFSRFDQLQLDRIVGSAAAKTMTTSEKSLFIFS